MKQKLIVDTKKRKLFVKEDNKIVKTIGDVRIGKNGTCSFEEMIEGGKKTPIGTYKLGIAFGTHDLNINYPYIKIDENSYWVDDVNSKYYNRFVQIGSKNINNQYIIRKTKKDFNSAEHLIDYKVEYEYAIFTGYNEKNIPKKGSAIFLHCHGKEYTSGCLSISKKDMEWILNNLDISQNPTIEIK